jgi:hypothetical protein
MCAVVGYQYGATSGAVESLIAQLHSLGIGKAHYAETQKTKNSTRKRNFKANERLKKVLELQIKRLIQKNICVNLVRLSLSENNIRTNLFKLLYVLFVKSTKHSTVMKSTENFSWVNLNWACGKFLKIQIKKGIGDQKYYSRSNRTKLFSL